VEVKGSWNNVIIDGSRDEASELRVAMRHKTL
jgi:hypothetical protein